MAETTLAEVEKLVKELDPNLPKTDDGFKVAVVLLSAAFVGANERRVQKFTGIDADHLHVMIENLRRAGIWKGGKIHSDWLDEETGGAQFWLDCAVAQGYMERAGGHS